MCDEYVVDASIGIRKLAAVLSAVQATSYLFAFLVFLAVLPGGCLVVRRVYRACSTTAGWAREYWRALRRANVPVAETPGLSDAESDFSTVGDVDPPAAKSKRKPRIGIDLIDKTITLPPVPEKQE